MADISLYLTNVNVSIGQNMAVQQTPNLSRDFECVELGEQEKREEQQQREKVPRRIIHFSSGETMEEYSTDEEEGEDKEPERKDLLSSPVDASKMTWGPYFWFHMWRAATSTISACDYLGERMASLFGITSAKYQYAIDEYYRMKKEREEEKEESRLSEEAERSFDQLQSQEDEDEPITMTDQPEVSATSASAHPDVTYQIENENQVPSSTIRVPAIVTAT
ncbi:protein FAM177A1-like isoform X2 [Seriola lalandi dorsalis]|uniref:protein FAM177A1-like isoform X2 n=1 Tax=Seriola lalandi dorsalis TaxID=1841481 RepID=UPI000C6F7FE2|nr:protein FAM177A1-like isoform X2 [Seriola lalandi dorsalis]XP_056260501.1 protein FAM177A1-like isoform X2 [Seriola aureovittata]